MNETSQFEKIARKIRELVLIANPKMKSLAAGKDGIDNYFNPKNGIGKAARPDGKFNTIEWNGDLIIPINALIPFQQSRNFEFPYELSWIHKVNGSLHIFSNKIESLVGCPQEVTEDFTISPDDKYIYSLEYGPKKVGRDYTAKKVRSLKNCPRIIEGRFIVPRGRFTDLKGGPNVVKGDLDCSHNGDLITLEGCPDIHGYLDCSNTGLKNFEHLPKNPEFKGVRLIRSMRLNSIQSWLGLKIDFNDPLTKDFFQSVYDDISDNPNTLQRFKTYIEILKLYPNFLESKDLMELYKMLNPLTLGEFTRMADVPKYDNVPEQIIRRLVTMLNS
jgi:hypothetical protein